MPFRRFIGYWGSVILGRWIGGLLGYKPFFREYTTDWDYAVAKMKGSWFQRHLAEEAYSKQLSWEEQVRLDRGKPLNAEYEPMTTDLTKRVADQNGSAGAVHDLPNGKVVTNGLRSRTSKSGGGAHEQEVGYENR